MFIRAGGVAHALGVRLTVAASSSSGSSAPVLQPVVQTCTYSCIVQSGSHRLHLCQPANAVFCQDQQFVDLRGCSTIPQWSSAANPDKLSLDLLAAFLRRQGVSQNRTLPLCKPAGTILVVLMLALQCAGFSRVAFLEQVKAERASRGLHLQQKKAAECIQAAYRCC